jgi:acetyl esterase/lipase
MATPIKIVLMCSVVLLLLGAVVACSPLSAINAVTSGSASEKNLAISYGEDPRQKLDIYRPRDSKSTAPVVVFFYGGSWNMGSRSDYAFVGEALAEKGFVAVVADYRLYPQVRYPSFVDDSARAVAWTLKEIQQYGGDPSKVFVMGHSAGAYNAAMVAIDQRWLAAAGASTKQLRGFIGLAGPYDFIPISDQDVRPVFFYPDTPAESQPINHVTAAAPPTLLIASHADKLVNPTRNTGGLAARLRSVGVPVQEIYFDNTSHASLIGAIAWPLRRLAPVLDTVAAFVKSDGGRDSATSAH